jgi:hypothetical protein
MRILAALGVSLAIALSTMAVTTTGAEAAKKPKSKQCVGTQLNGKQTKFKCKADEKCCYSAVTNTGSCVPANGICL